jgi:transposase InsO family protein
MNCQNCQKPLLTVLTVTGVGIFAEIGPTIQIAAANTPPPNYRKVLGAAGMIQSMSRKGNCWDNASIESCFGTLKTELVHLAC